MAGWWPLPDEQGRGAVYAGAAYTGTPGERGFPGASDEVVVPWTRLADDVGSFTGLHVRKQGRRVLFSGVTDGSGAGLDDNAVGPGGVDVPEGLAEIIDLSGEAFMAAEVVAAPLSGWGPSNAAAILSAATSLDLDTGDMQACYLSDLLAPGVTISRHYGLTGDNIVIIGWNNLSYDAEPSEDQ